MKNEIQMCVQCGKSMGAALTDEQREAVAEAARYAAGEG
jgi:hypothetical protein